MSYTGKMPVLEILGFLALLLVSCFVVQMIAEEVPQWYCQRPWDPPGLGTLNPDLDVAAIFKQLLVAHRCKKASVRLSDDSEAMDYCRKALGDAYSETSQNMFSPVEFTDENHAEVYFQRVRGPLNGTGGTFAVSRRKSGRWGIDDWVGPHWQS